MSSHGLARFSAQAIRDDIALTKLRLHALEAELALAADDSPSKPAATAPEPDGSQLLMPLEDYDRYGRQMILPTIGLPGQLALREASVLVIGAGGLGCPALLYLVGAGVGHITILDHDVVELSNLHRQVLHSMHTVGLNKAESAKLALLERNPSIDICVITEPLTPTLAVAPGGTAKWGSYDLMLDCSDNRPTRSLLNLISALHSVPLVSGSALRAEGQVSVWNLPLRAQDNAKGPCMQCVFPECPGEGDISSCEDVGVLGPAVGTVGVVMAWEAIKLLTGHHDLAPRMLLLSSFRTFKLRPRNPNCELCSGSPSDMRARLYALADAEAEGKWTWATCGPGERDEAHHEPRITPQRLGSLTAAERRQWRLLDVRTPIEFGICRLPGSVNVPLPQLLADPAETIRSLSSPPAADADKEQSAGSDTTPRGETLHVVLVCKKGNDSLVAARALREALSSSAADAGISGAAAADGGSAEERGRIEVTDLAGGLRSYAKSVDSRFPLY